MRTMHSSTRVAVFAALAVIILPIHAAERSTSAARSDSWVTAWGTSQVAPMQGGTAANNQTLRLIVHPSLGGNAVRVRIANTLGNQELKIGAASVGVQAKGSSVVADTLKALTFSGRTSLTIAPAATWVSDPVELRVKAGENLAVSVYVSNDAGVLTAHPGATQVSYLSSTGDFAAQVDGAAFGTEIPTWPLLASVEVLPATQTRSIVTFGDSITDGFKSTTNANQRWPDIFAERLQAAGRQIAVVNQGISGNRILNDSLMPPLRFGPNALSRFDRDVLAMSGVTHVVVLIGINDIGMGSPTRNAAQTVSAEDIVAAYRQLIARAHAKGLKIIGGTLLPFKGAAYFYDEGETKRQAVNEWIRSSKEWDGVIDFDRATRDPAKVEQLLPAYDSGDHLHPNDAGYRVMANSVDLKLFE